MAWVVAEGTPEQVAAEPASHTGKFLRDVLGDRVSDASVPARPAAGKAPARKPAAKKTAAKKAPAKKATARKAARKS